MAQTEELKEIMFNVTDWPQTVSESVAFVAWFDVWALWEQTELRKDAAERKREAVWKPNGLPIKLAGFPILLGLLFLFSPSLVFSFSRT
jgi:hypothetical protein